MMGVEMTDDFWWCPSCTTKHHQPMDEDGCPDCGWRPNYEVN